MVKSAAQRMDDIYRLQRHVYDATRAYYLLGRDRLIADLAASKPGTTVLEVACGTGRNLIAAAKKYPQAQLYGFDISENMLATAGATVSRQGLAHRVCLAHGDATNFDAKAVFGIAHFDRVFISYALSMIPDWRLSLASAATMLAPGGRLSIVDFGDFAGQPAAFCSLQRAWLRRFSVMPVQNLDLELMRFAETHGLTCASSGLYRGYSVLADLRRPLQAGLAKAAAGCGERVSSVSAPASKVDQHGPNSESSRRLCGVTK